MRVPAALGREAVTVYRAKDRRSRGADGKPQAKAYRYDFEYRGRRYTSPRPFPTMQEARDAEAELRRRLRRAAAGLEVDGGRPTMAIADWAEIYMDYLERRGRLRNLTAVEHVLRVVLRFWGRKPARELKAHERGPFHDLSLLTPIDEPRHLLAFEDWMVKRGIAGATRNRYRTAMSRLYAVAMRPEFRQATSVTMNPFLALERDAPRGRTVTLSVEQLRAVLGQASPHLRLAIAIAALAPKLRLGNVLALRWDTHIDRELTTITVAEHKTVGVTGRPLVTPISAQLRTILLDARSRQPRGVPWVIHYRRESVRTIDTGLKAACEAAGVPYGLQNGATFHTIRHTAATQLAALGVPEGLRKDVLGHRSIATTQLYTHLQPAHLVAPLEQLSEAFPLVDLLVGTPVGPRKKSGQRRAATTDAD